MLHQPTSQELNNLQQQLDSLTLREALQLLSSRFPGEVSFSTSFSLEDQLITHEILDESIPVSIFTLDTGRLFPETYSVWTSTNSRYNTRIKAYYPDELALQELVAAKGPNLFYESVENRKACCNVRKVEPLQRALKGQSVWVTGLRAEHSAVRQGLQQLEWDSVNRLIKFHPLLHWNTAEVRGFVEANNIPYNPLHDRGFVSIGCAPCTRAVREGEDFRAGRWWWEDNSKKECGLHEHPAAVNINR